MKLEDRGVARGRCGGCNNPHSSWTRQSVFGSVGKLFSQSEKIFDLLGIKSNSYSKNLLNVWKLWKKLANYDVIKNFHMSWKITICQKNFCMFGKQFCQQLWGNILIRNWCVGKCNAKPPSVALLEWKLLTSEVASFLCMRIVVTVFQEAGTSLARKQWRSIFERIWQRGSRRRKWWYSRPRCGLR